MGSWHGPETRVIFKDSAQASVPFSAQPGEEGSVSACSLSTNITVSCSHSGQGAVHRLASNDFLRAHVEVIARGAVTRAGDAREAAAPGRRDGAPSPARHPAARLPSRVLFCDPRLPTACARAPRAGGWWLSTCQSQQGHPSHSRGDVCGRARWGRRIIKHHPKLPETRGFKIRARKASELPSPGRPGTPRCAPSWFLER